MNRRIEIIGGGLAGLSLGIALRKRGVDATIWESSRYPRHRVCGEFISGVNSETLDSIGIADLMADAPVLRSSAWWLNDQPLFSADLPEPARGLSRFELDLRLARRFQELGGDLKEGERYIDDDRLREGLVWATGREPAKSNLLGLSMHLVGFDLKADLEMHFSSGGYAGLCAIEGGRVNLSALFHRDPAVKARRKDLFQAYLQSCGFQGLIQRIANSEIDQDSHAAVSSVPVGSCRSASIDEPCAIGDHFGAMGPFTGNGMSLAFESAAAAADPLAQFASGELDWDQAKLALLTKLRSQFHRRLSASTYLHKALLNPVGLRGISMLGRAGLLPFRFLYRQVR
ncbi:MAG: FAD-dependent monooxygenase [Verrucomicrobiota bacterium]